MRNLSRSVAKATNSSGDPTNTQKGDQSDLHVQKYITFWRTNAKGDMSPKKLRIRQKESSCSPTYISTNSEKDATTNPRIVRKECEADMQQLFRMHLQKAALRKNILGSLDPTVQVYRSCRGVPNAKNKSEYVSNRPKGYLD